MQDANTNTNGVIVSPGEGLLESDADCRRYIQSHMHMSGSVLKFTVEQLPNGQNY